MLLLDRSVSKTSFPKQDKEEHLPHVCEFQTYAQTSQISRGGGYSGFQVIGMIEWGQKSKPKKKKPIASSKTKKKISQPKFKPTKIPCLIFEP